MRGLFNLIHEAFHMQGTRAWRATSAVMWSTIGLSILLLVLEGVFQERGAVPGWLEWVDNLVLVIFALEILLRVLSYRPAATQFYERSGPGWLVQHITGRLLYCMQPLNLIDILSTLALVPALRGLRLLRLLRLLRGVRMSRYNTPFQGLVHAFQDNGLLFGFGFALLGISSVLGGWSLFLVERGVNKSLASPADGMWWALVTLTTVGYGDISPITPLGRVIGGCLMIMGMFVLALFAGIIGHTLLNAVLSISKEQFRMSNYMNHIVVCGYDEGARILLDVLMDEASQLQTDVVLFAPQERPQDVPPQFIWAQGDPSKEADLAKARIQYASAVVVVASRKIKPQMADANTILIIFTLRAWLKRHQSTLRRAKPLYIAAEILEPENVIHAHTAGADEVIETTRLGFSLLGHAISEPGTAAIVSSVASFGQHSLYIGRNPMSEPMDFGALSDQLHKMHGIMLLGIRDAQGVDQINPARTLRVDPGAELFYLGEQSVLKAAPR